MMLLPLLSILEVLFLVFFQNCKPIRPSLERALDYEVIVPAYNNYDVLPYNGGNIIYAKKGKSKPEAIKNVLDKVKAEYVVILDGDTELPEGIPNALASMIKAGADFASLFVTVKPENFLTLMQRFEYNIAMMIRRWLPYLLSGACYIARTDALRKVFDKHSLRFEGEDLEVGLIAKRLGFKIVHIDVVVETKAPSRLRSLIEQRIIWFKGLYRLTNRRNIKYLVFPLFYTTFFIFLLLPLKLLDIYLNPSVIAYTYGIYLLPCLFKNRNWKMLLFPFYNLLFNVFLNPICFLLSIFKTSLLSLFQESSN